MIVKLDCARTIDEATIRESRSKGLKYQVNEIQMVPGKYRARYGGEFFLSI